jgi:hypothetical protein
VEADINDNARGLESGGVTSLKPCLAQIDDSGIGSPVGGAAIGVIDAGTGAFRYKLVGVEYFQDGYKNEYQDRVVEIVRELFSEMGITSDVSASRSAPATSSTTSGPGWTRQGTSGSPSRSSTRSRV